MITRILVFSVIGFLQLMRSRMYLNVLVAGAALVAVALGVDELSAGQADRVLINVGLGLISLIVAVLAVVTGVGTITREIESKQIHLVLARPVRRAEIVLGRFVTIALLVVFANIILGVTLALTITLVDGEGAGRALFAAVFSSFEGFIVAAIAIFFGTSSSSTVSTLFTTTLFLLGRLSPLLHDLILRGKFSPPLSTLLDWIYVALPHFFRFDLSAWARGQGALVGAELAQSLAYGSLYVVALLAFATWKLERRDLL